MCKMVNLGERWSTQSPARLGSPNAETICAGSEMAAPRISRTASRPLSEAMATSHSVAKRSTLNMVIPKVSKDHKIDFHRADGHASVAARQSRHFSIHIRLGGRRLHFKQRNLSRNDQACVAGEACAGALMNTAGAITINQALFTRCWPRVCSMRTSREESNSSIAPATVMGRRSVRKAGLMQ